MSLALVKSVNCVALKVEEKFCILWQHSRRQVVTVGKGLLLAQVVGDVDALLHVGQELDQGQLHLDGHLRLAGVVLPRTWRCVDVVQGRVGEGWQRGGLACLEVA